MLTPEDIASAGPATNELVRAWFAADLEVLDELLVDAREVPIPNAKIDRYAAALMGNPRALQWLQEKRGITVATAQSFKLGLDGGRVVIPIMDRRGRCRNARLYRPGGRPKMLGLPGRRMRLFPQRAFLERTEQPFVAVEGELDAVVGWQEGVRCVTSGGASTLSPWRRNLSRFTGERVWILFDNDDAGRNGACRLAELLEPVVASVRVLRLPLDHPGADLTDFVLSRRQRDAA